MVDLRKLFTDDHRSEKVGKYLFGPDVVKPFHGDQITEPHVGGLMCNQTAASQLAREGGIAFKKHRSVGIQGCSHVFHAAVLKTRNDNQIVFGKGVGNTGVCFEPVE